MEKVTISKLDNYGRGICYIDDKITFVYNALPKEIVFIDDFVKYSKYQEAIVKRYEKISIDRVEPVCPYYNACGGCQLMHLSYEDNLKFKEDKLKSILSKYGNYNGNIIMNGCSKDLYYRNKVTLKINNYKVGYYEGHTHKLVEISKCVVGNEDINNFIKDIKTFNIKNGSIVIRCNYKHELLLSINTDQKLKLDSNIISKHKIVGIVLNDDTIYGNNYFIDKINSFKYKVSYNSFFQINPYMTSEIFKELENLPNDYKNVLDLYCGVGTLGIVVADKVESLFGVEIVENAVRDAKYNSSANILENTTYYCGNVANVIPKLPKDIDLIIVDPPRSGLDKETITSILTIKPQNIIYMSCDVMTLARDLKVLQNKYDIISVKGYDMFPYTYHVECVCVLKLK
ncbi:MAG: class I SAM-dependent RNA methyltransferase [Bacilli bacterium]